MINYSAQWIDKAILITAIVFVCLYMLKMVGWLINNKRINERIKTLYKSKIKKVIYLCIFLFGSFLLLTKLKITEYILMVLTIGALYDYFFALFPKQSTELVEESMKNKTSMWFFGITFPILLAVGLIVYLIFMR